MNATLATVYGIDYYAWPTITVICVVVVLATGVNSLIAARYKPVNINEALVLHGFVLLLVAALGATHHLHMQNEILALKGLTGEGLFDPAQDALDRAAIAKSTCRFTVTVACGALIGTVATMVRKKA